MIRIGGSCGGRYSRPIIGITTYENRILQNNEHAYFWPDSAFCTNNKIFLIVNIDSYITGGRWRPTNQQLRDFVINTKNQLKSIGATKLNCRFTVDNESEEWTSFEAYMNWVRVIHDALMGEFDLGAGNFGTNARSWYESLVNLYNQGYYEVLDIHYQNGLNNKTDITAFSNWVSNLKNSKGIKRIACTEGNNFYRVTTATGHGLVKFQINEAERIGCEDFCFVYCNWMHNGIESDNDMSYNYNFNQVSPFWPDMLNFINEKKPKDDDGMKLDTIYKNGSRGIGVQFIQMVLNSDIKPEPLLKADGIWGVKTNAIVLQYQKKYSLSQYEGAIGANTMQQMINLYPDIWDNIEYKWAIGVR